MQMNTLQQIYRGVCNELSVNCDIPPTRQHPPVEVTKDTFVITEARINKTYITQGTV